MFQLTSDEERKAYIQTKQDKWIKLELEREGLIWYNENQ